MWGNETTDEAIAAANQVNTISLPKIIWLNCPSGLELLKIINKKNPIITGGSAKGKETSRSNTKFNGVFRFTNNHPTLTYVQRGNADAGLVYRTDAALARNLLVLDIIPLNVYDQILYIAAVQKSSHNLDQAIGFCEFLLTEKARTIFDNHGFSFP